MAGYPKQILTIQQQLQSYKDAGMEISSEEDVVSALETIGYYRIRGYCFQVYNKENKHYIPGTKFSDILELYHFDTSLSHLLLEMTSSIEISLRARLVDALLVNENALALFSPEYFKDKELFWQNQGKLSYEIARSREVFIQHDFNNHEGLVPVWAAVEVMSFGNLSKTIKNLKTGAGSAAKELLSHYQYKSGNGRLVQPSLNMFSSWTQAVSVLRNMCAHNSRIYNRTVSTHPQIPSTDHPTTSSGYTGLYQLVLAMKYLRPNDPCWLAFVERINALLDEYEKVVELRRINFPPDWKNHLEL